MENNGLQQIKKLVDKVNNTQLPDRLKQKAYEQIERIGLVLKYGGNFAQIDMTEKYIEWITSLPWFKTTEDHLNLDEAKAMLDKDHYGAEKVKQRVLEYLSILNLQRKKINVQTYHTPVLFFVGLVGTGKTTFAISIAKTLGRKFIRIPFGGLSSALDLRGQSKTKPESEPGMIIKGLRRVGTKNPVILLDELDRVDPEARASIMGVLVELLDPEQNSAFTDYFIDYPFNLSQALFIATANNTRNISTAVMDRLEVIQMPSYTDEEKIVIAKNYILPRFLKESGLNPDSIKVDDSVWQKITRPLGYDAGVRGLERTIEGIVRRVAFKIIKGEGTSFTINDSNLKAYLE